MGVDPTHNESHVEPDPEKALALAVVLTAMQDVANGAGTTEADRAQARAFLFATSGPWAASRRAWLEIAEVDDGWLQRRLGKPPTDSPKDRRRLASKRPASEWDQRVLDWLRSEGHLPGFGRRRKAELARILDDAGFRAPKGGPVTRDTTFFFIERNADAFGG